MTANLRLYNTPFNGSDLTSFAARELTTRRISDNVYEVTGRKVEPHNFDGWTSEEALLAPNDPYGAFYEISFNIEAREPNVLITQNNFVITNFKAQGYYKWRNDWYHYDILYKFSFESAVAVIDDEHYSNGSCELVALFADTYGESPSWRWEVSQKWFDAAQYEDANHNIQYKYTSKSESNKGSTTRYLYADFGMTLHW